MIGYFPLWQKNTKEIMSEFLDLGFRTVVVCVNSAVLPSHFVGREVDHNFLNELPSEVDPCGENGEFHTFTYDGPIFEFPIRFKKGDLIFKTYPSPDTDEDTCGSGSNEKQAGFYYSDLIPL